MLHLDLLIMSWSTHEIAVQSLTREEIVKEIRRIYKDWKYFYTWDNLAFDVCDPQTGIKYAGGIISNNNIHFNY